MNVLYFILLRFVYNEAQKVNNLITFVIELLFMRLALPYHRCVIAISQERFHVGKRKFIA